MVRIANPKKPSAPEPIRPDHRLDTFDCGVPALNAWLQRRAHPNEFSGASRTFVVTDGEVVIGFYSLASASVLHSHATGKVKRNMPDPVPAVLLGRLALDKRWQGRRLGLSLLQDAVLRVVGAAETVGVRVILVHAKSDDAKRFYMQYGFRESPLEPMTLIMTVAETRRMLEE
jgi:GNAT superfamily N-acetyltransferase